MTESLKRAKKFRLDTCLSQPTEGPRCPTRRKKFDRGVKSVGINNRHKEIKRRRHRTKKLALLRKRLEKASEAEKAEIVRKLRELTPGAEEIIKQWQLTEIAG